MLDVAATASISMVIIGDLQPRGPLASKTEDFLGFLPFPARKTLVFGSVRAVAWNLRPYRARLALPLPRMAKTYFL
jgi:hypothetical protein